MTSINGSVALVTGGSRGIGKALVEEIYARGAAKVYATARDPRTVSHPDAVPLALELTDPDSAAVVADRAPDVTALINNAGASFGSSFLDTPKILARSVATQALDGIEANALEVIADELTRQVKAGLAADPAIFYPQVAAGR